MSKPIKSRHNLTRCSICRAHIEAGDRPSTTECPFCGANLHMSRGRAWLPGRGGVLAASLLAFTVTACGGADETSGSDDTTTEPVDDTSGDDHYSDDPADDRYPSWSPDGTRITFNSDRDGNPEIYSMSSDGSDPVRLTENDAPDLAPAWSPDGERIVFLSERDGNPEIYVMRADGSEQTRLTTDGAGNSNPRWLPTQAGNR